MGLSNQERFEHIVFAIKYLNETVDRCKSFKAEQKLVSLIDQLWPAALRSQSNDLFWIMGSGFHESKMESGLPFTILSSLIPSKETEDFGDQKWKTYEYICNSIETATVISEERASTLFKVYCYMEKICYALRRYDDEFRESFRELDDLVAKIQGELFSRMTCSPCILEGYLIHQIAHKIVVNFDLNAEFDLLYEVWSQFHFNHHIRTKHYLTREILLKEWKKIQFKDKLSDEDRLRLSLMLVGHSFHYKHEHEKLFKMTDGLIDKDKVQSMIDNCVKLHENETESSRSSYDSYCALTRGSKDDQEENDDNE